MRANIVIAGRMEQHGGHYNMLGIGLHGLTYTEGPFVEVSVLMVLQTDASHTGDHTIELDLLDADARSIGSPYPHRKTTRFGPENRALVWGLKVATIPAKDGDYLFAVRVDGEELTTYEVRLLYQPAQ